MEEIEDANQQIEIAKNNLAENNTQMMGIDDRCERLRGLLSPIISQITAELVGETQTQARELADLTGTTDQSLAGATLESVMVATRGTQNVHALNARTFAQQASETFSSEAKPIRGSSNELCSSVEQLLFHATNIAGILETIHEAQTKVQDIIGGPDDEAGPALPHQRQSGEHGGPPESMPAPGLIPSAIRSLNQLQQDF